MAYCVQFLSDSSYSEIPESWLIDEGHCWWPKAKNPILFMTKNILPNESDGTWGQFEIVIEKRCSKNIFLLIIHIRYINHFY